MSQPQHGPAPGILDSELSLSSPFGSQGLYAPPPPQNITRVVVIALDKSDHSEKAFSWSLDNFLRPESDLVVLVNVRPIVTLPGPFGSAYMDFQDYILRTEEKNREESHRLLRRASRPLKQRQIAVKGIAMRGDPRQEITRKVHELSADALIVGSRGMSALKRALMGSVSDYLAHNCRCAVIIVRNDCEVEIGARISSLATLGVVLSKDALEHPSSDQLLPSLPPAQPYESAPEPRQPRDDDLVKPIPIQAPHLGEHCSNATIEMD
ncbi:uncharacterized protein BJ171DRAFT_518939 [Polychytrium aggregatum]|uniref:uncharacterized protein n=1 Tax=Polychytrium aggregatum TaxID=110093 RepID=UPI0022FDF123|nr:uncharacterized protein BJ171DRAFT_518939 [Polychytrium aggregatum]KAI9199374.1 hypothetical protein BJ171DRAFT_518939 [Polychytrium aggregatum]